MAKMDVFISWSGQRSRAVAEALKKYLPMIVNDLNPWLSSTDIDKGSRSTEEIAVALSNARAGIICLTPNNLKEPWILFEAGAIAKTVREKPLACTLLIGLGITDVSGPLSQFQATKPTRMDMLHLVKTLNKALGESAVDEPQIEETFDLCWSKLKEIFDSLPSDGPNTKPERRPEDMLKELVEISRVTSTNVVQGYAQITSQLAGLNDSLRLPLARYGTLSALSGTRSMNFLTEEQLSANFDEAVRRLAKKETAKGPDATSVEKALETTSAKFRSGSKRKTGADKSK